MKRLIVVSFIIFSVFFSLSGQTITSLGVSGKYYDIRSDNTGTIHILWRDNGVSKYGQIVNGKVVNQETIPVVTRNEVVIDKFRPRLSVKPDGSQVHFVWVTPDIQSKDLMHAWRDSKGTWRKEKIYTSSKFVEYPTFTIDSRGVLHASCIEWTSSSDLHPIVYYRKAVGGSWTRMANLANATAKHLWPNLYTDANGNVHITWDKNKATLQYRYAASGGSLSASSTITLPLAAHDKNKQGEVFADAEGNVHVAALSYSSSTGGSEGGIDYWVKPVGGSFSSPIQVTGGNFSLLYYFPHPAVIARSADLIAVSWAQEPQTSARVKVAVYNGGWTLYTLSTTGNFKDFTRSAMAMDNLSAYLVWREADGSLYCATFDYVGAKALTVTSPNGGEVWISDSIKNITWEASGLSNNLKITLWKDDVLAGLIATDVDPARGSYSWGVGSIVGALAPDGTGYTIKIKEVGTSVSDTSDAPFEIVTPQINVTSPNGGESWGSATARDITWSSAGLSSNLKITLWKDNELFGTIATNINPGQGSYSWAVGSVIGGVAPNATGYTIKIKEVGTAVSDISDAPFEIVDPQITLTSPNGRENWFNGSLENITWDASGLAGNVKVTLWKDGLFVGTIVTGVDPAVGSYSWTVGEYIGGSAAAGTGYTIKIKEIGTAIADFSDAEFTIANPQITILSPNGGEFWGLGDSRNITWSYAGLSNNIKITLWQNGVLMGVIATDIDPTSGSYNWTVGEYTGGTASAGDLYTIKIKEVGTAVADFSDTSFSILITD